MRVLVFTVLVAYAARVYAFESLLDVLAQQNATTALSLVNQAGFTDDLRDHGPFTLLVPTDAAFAKIPKADLDPLMNNQSALQNLLQYHLINGEIFTWDLKAVDHLTSINGHHIRVYMDSSAGHFFNQAFAVKEEIQASNGVMYLIDEVLDVPEGKILSILNNTDYNISIFRGLVHKAGLDRTFNFTNGRYTVFAPSNEAFNKLPSTFLHSIQNSATYAKIVVDYQTHRGTIHESTLANGGSISTINNGHYIKVSHDAGTGETLLNDKAHFIQTDIEADNGVVHVTSHVLIPSNLSGLVGGIVG